MSDNFLVEAKVVVAKEWGNERMQEELMKVEELKKLERKKEEKKGISGQFESGI